MKILRAFKTELDPNNVQRTSLVRHCGAARFAYNWGLEQKVAAYDASEKTPSAFDLMKRLGARKHSDLSWLTDVSKYVHNEPLRDLDMAFSRYFDYVKKNKAGKVKAKKKRKKKRKYTPRQIELRQHVEAFPKLKSRKNGIGSCRFHEYNVFEGAIRLPRIGKIRLKQCGYLPVGRAVKERPDVKYYGATVTERAGRWFVSVHVEIEVPDPPVKMPSVVGVDFGIKTLATCSDGTVFENPKALKKAQRKLKKMQRAVSRKVKGSANRKKAVRVLAVAHARVANIRNNTLHQISNKLTKTNSVVVIEDLNVAGMMKNHHLAQAISDCGFGELRRQLTYKGLWRGCEIIIADRFFPSSKACSSCGTVRETLKLSERTFRCDCGFEIDRDLNAAINLRNVAGRMPETQNACGCESAGSDFGLNETFAREAGTKQLRMFAV